MKITKIALILFILLVGSAQGFGASVSISNSAADAGAAVQIPINGSFDFPLTSCQFTITYNPSVLNCTGAVSGDLTGGWTVSTNALTGEMRVLVNDGTGNGIAPGSGNLVKLNCTAASNPGASTPVTFSGVNVLVDIDINEYIPTTTPGTFTINGGCIPTTEVCDGVDNDCDGQIDEGVKNTYYRDVDNDTFGNPNDTTQACTIPQGYVSNNTDCNDSNHAVKPGATETCNNIDDNCDSTIDNGIASTPTTCGVGFCASTGQSACQGGQMVDTCTPGTPQTEGPFGNATCSDSSDNDCDGATDAADSGCIQQCVPSTEVCDGVDNDCDQQTDEGIAAVPTTCGIGACQRLGQSTCQSGEMVDSCTPGTLSSETCNGIDDDCDGTVDDGVKNTYYRDADNDTFGNLNNTTQACTLPQGYVSNNTDCNDSNPAVKPGATETCNNIDDNCDGQTDNGIASTPTSCGTGACASTGQSICQGGQIINTCTSGNPQTEGPFGNATCSDSSDNDCDGTTDAADSGCVEVCTPSTEVCDGVDNDCDDQVDEGVKNTYYRDADNDTFGNPNDTTQACTLPQGYVSNNTDCNDSNPAVKPGAIETCDSVDNNCDGQTDNGIASVPTTCGVGACASAGQSICQGGQMVDTCKSGNPQTEGPFGNATCSDSTDNDCDGSTDASDSGCAQQCTPSTEVCDGVDNDCDSQIDEDIAAVPTTCGVGACAANGQSTCQAGQMVNSCIPGTPQAEGPFSNATCSDSSDNDCDGSTDTADSGCVQQCTPSTEVCDGADNDCDGQIDEDIAAVPTTCGVGACASTGQSVCQGGQMINTCTPSNPQTEGPFGNPTCADSSDNDCDGTTDASDSGCVEVCTPSTEVCDGVDNDCDGQIDEDIASVPTTCGAGACASAGQSICQGGQMVNTCTPGDPQTEGPFGNPTCSDLSDNDCDGAVDTADSGCVEVCAPSTEVCDGLDNDCDGQVDDDIAAVPTTCGVGICAANGQSTCQAGQMVNSCIPGTPQTEGPFGNPTCSDSSDNDCDGSSDASDSGCGQQCTPSTEICDGIDNDCDSQIDEDIAAAPTTCGVGACASTGQSICQGAQMVNTCTPGNPQTEGPFGNPTCSDSSDNDCDGSTDASDSGCVQQCTPSTEVCDGVDNNCDGQIDEDIAVVPTTCGVGACTANGQSTCQAGQMVNSCIPGTPSPEICNTIDDNCDGTVDNGVASTPTTCGIGACASTGQMVCQSGQMVDTCTPGAPQTEGPLGNPTCSDSADNDCDGSTDASDSGCLIQPADMSQWTGKWFSIKERGSQTAGRSGQQGITFSVPDAKFGKEKNSGSGNGYMHIWNWDPGTRALHFDYYTFIEDKGTWDTYTDTLQFFAGTDMKFLFLYHRSHNNQVTAFNGEIEGKIKKGALQGATLKTFGGYYLDISDDETSYSAGNEAMTGKMIDASKVPVPFNVIIPR